MTTIRTHAERDQRALALVIALAAAVAAILVAVMLVGSDDAAAPLQSDGSGTALNVGGDHRAQAADHAAAQDGGQYGGQYGGHASEY